MKLLLLLAIVAAATARVRWHEITEDFDFDQYLARHPKSYHAGSAEYVKRKAIFDAKLADVRAHNEHPTHQWKKGLNDWSDLSDSEFAELFGKKATEQDEFVENAAEAADEEEEEGEAHDTIDSYFKGLPATVDWAKSGHTTAVKAQCGGSCWAHTTTEMLESGLAQTYGLRKNKIPQISVQEVMSCTPNPKHCGGSGGCGGATVELAMDWVKKNGATLMYNYPLGDKNHFSAQFCPCTNACRNKFLEKSRPKVQFHSYKALPKNKFYPLLKAVQKGPVAISVGTNGWQDYDGGVLSCSKTPDTVIGHAVLLVGYGKTKSGQRYWKVRNSWGPGWGEDGYVRVMMRTNEHKFCGKNRKPKEGTGCDGGPKEVPVCGTCGILFDSVSTKGVHMVDHKGRKMSRKAVKRHLRGKKSFLEELESRGALNPTDSDDFEEQPEEEQPEEEQPEEEQPEEEQPEEKESDSDPESESEELHE